MTRIWLALALLIGLNLSTPQAASAQGLDPHKIYEKSCQSCHNEHGADMSRQRFKVANGILRVARTGTAVDQLLKKHHGVKLSADEMTVIIDLFKKGIAWGGVFQHRCASCHGRAADFARAKLGIADGNVRTLAGNVDVGSFLATHGEATPAEIATLMEMLRYQLETVPK